MNTDYIVESTFDCCGKTMVSVRMKSAVCVMPYEEFKWIMHIENKNNRMAA